MGFAEDCRRFSVKIQELQQVVFDNATAKAFDSITQGSTITGAPGQPVDTGNLRTSWQHDGQGTESQTISTNSEYALPNEYGITEDGRPYAQRSAIGGRHSVALTVAGWQNLVDASATELK